MVECFAITRAGVGKAQNEDRVVICDTVLDGGEDSLCTDLAACASVFDGVSQGGRGSEAASLAAESLADCARRDAALFDDATSEATLSALFGEVQERLLARAAGERLRLAPACTASGIVITHAGRVVGFNVGDSRVYRLRAGMLFQMSEDHSYVRELFSHGASDELLAVANETESHVITRALGIPSKASRVIDVEDYGEAQPGDLFLGCTDGIYGSMAREELKRTLGRVAAGDAPEDVGRALLDAAILGGSTDDMTLFLVAVGDDERTDSLDERSDDGR